MNKVIIFTVVLISLYGLTYAADPENGRKLFADPLLGRGTSGKTCNTCHEGGLDLNVNMAEKSNFELMGVQVADIREAINFCIEVTLRGEDLDPHSKEMEDILAYLEILARHWGGKKYAP